jgi:hypothetical protein
MDGMAREPMLVEHPDGTLFLTGYGEPTPRLWRSNDAGATWTRVEVASETDGAVGNSDVDLAIAPDGTLYLVAMTFDRKKNEGTRIAIGPAAIPGRAGRGLASRTHATPIAPGSRWCRTARRT